MQYLKSEGYLKDIVAYQLTEYGRNYFEDWIRHFEVIEHHDKEDLKRELYYFKCKSFQI